MRQTLLRNDRSFLLERHVWSARVTAVALLSSGILLWPPSTPDAYPYDAVAFRIAAAAAAMIGLGLAVASFVGESSAFWGRAWVIAGLVASAAALASSAVMRVDWYAGAPSCCFVDDFALSAIPVLGILGAASAVVALAVLTRRPDNFEFAARLTVVGLALALVMAHTVRFVPVAALPTHDSASATLRSDCRDAPNGKLARPDCVEATP